MLPRSSHCSTRNISAIPCQMHPSSHTSAVWTLCAPLCRSAIPGRTHHWAKEHCTRTGISSIKVCARAGRSTSSRFARICACVVTLRHSAASCLLNLENFLSRCIRQLWRRWCIASGPVEGPASTIILLYHFHFQGETSFHPSFFIQPLRAVTGEPACAYHGNELRILRRPDGSIGMALVLPALTDCRWWFESLLVHLGVSSATRRKATGADHKKSNELRILANLLNIRRPITGWQWVLPP